MRVTITLEHNTGVMQDITPSVAYEEGVCFPLQVTRAKLFKQYAAAGGHRTGVISNSGKSIWMHPSWITPEFQLFYSHWMFWS